MNRDQVKQRVLRVLGEIAPEADPATIEPGEALREQLDIDSVDLLTFVIGLHKEFEIEIPESDYPKLATLDACVEYLGARAS
jgi:acyl carrier protein